MSDLSEEDTDVLIDELKKRSKRVAIIREPLVQNPKDWYSVSYKADEIESLIGLLVIGIVRTVINGVPLGPDQITYPDKEE